MLWHRNNLQHYGFVDCVSFWCSDNAFIEQVKKIGILPMLVVNSKVEHLGSKTLSGSENYEELTKEQVKIFNTKYKKNLFGWGI